MKYERELFYYDIVHEFGEITQNAIVAVQGHSCLTDFGTNRKLICDFLLVIKLPPLAPFPR